MYKNPPHYAYQGRNNNTGGTKFSQYWVSSKTHQILQLIFQSKPFCAKSNFP